MKCNFIEFVHESSTFALTFKSREAFLRRDSDGFSLSFASYLRDRSGEFFGFGITDI